MPTRKESPQRGSFEETLGRFYDSASVLMGTVELIEDDIVHISDNWATAAFFGTTPAAMEGRTAREMSVPERFITMWLGAYQASTSSAEPVRFDYEHADKGWLSVTVNRISLSENGRQRCLYVAVDITERKRAEQALRDAHDQLEARVKERTVELELANRRLKQEANYDSLTGLPNRRLFSKRLRHSLERRRDDTNVGFAVLFMDLDRFKVVNDSLGHPAGDALLTAVAKRLEACVRDGDTVARFGGDEFTILLEDCDDERAAEVASRLRRTLEEPFSVWGRTFTLSGSVGIVFSEKGHSRPHDLLRDADLAMYHAKANHSGQMEVFQPAMRESAVQRLQLEADLRTALEARALSVRYQPIVRLVDLSLVGFEALVRWQHPELGFLSPGSFIPVAEESGLIVELDRLVLNKACEQLAAWRSQFPQLGDLSVNVNLSSRQFLERSLVSEVEHALARVDLEPGCLNLEITESLQMRPTKAVNALVTRLASLGVGVCLDDFGTGYTSLSYLSRFPATHLKVDRTFIRNMGENDKSVTLVEGVTMMAQKLGMRVVAEGVETQEQLAHLRELGCEYGQGYLFAKPLTVTDVDTFVATRCV